MTCLWAHSKSAAELSLRSVFQTTCLLSFPLPLGGVSFFFLPVVPFSVSPLLGPGTSEHKHRMFGQRGDQAGKSSANFI